MGQRLRLGLWKPGDALPASLTEMLDYMKSKAVKPVACESTYSWLLYALFLEHLVIVLRAFRHLQMCTRSWPSSPAPTPAAQTRPGL